MQETSVKVDSIPRSERAPGEGNGNPLQYSCLENPMDREAWWATVHGGLRVGCNLVTEQQHKEIYFKKMARVIVCVRVHALSCV